VAWRGAPLRYGIDGRVEPVSVRGQIARASSANATAPLIAWLQILALHGDLAAAEPKRLRYRVLHTAARLTRGQRRRWLRIHARWPWADQITAAFTRIAAIPAPG
jgi:hypothetical protein